MSEPAVFALDSCACLPNVADVDLFGGRALLCQVSNLLVDLDFEGICAAADCKAEATAKILSRYIGVLGVIRMWHRIEIAERAGMNAERFNESILADPIHRLKYQR